jgi:hypothetical protein
VLAQQDLLALKDPPALLAFLVLQVPKDPRVLPALKDLPVLPANPCKPT